MNSTELGTYEAPGQPDIIVTYGGELRDDKDHHSPWVFWRFPWEENGVKNETLWFEFHGMLRAGNYKLVTRERRAAQPEIGGICPESGQTEK